MDKSSVRIYELHIIAFKRLQNEMVRFDCDADDAKLATIAVRNIYGKYFHQQQKNCSKN